MRDVGRGRGGERGEDRAHNGGSSPGPGKRTLTEALPPVQRRQDAGNSVAFRDAPSLHTAAHEAAHVVQQAAGVSLLGGVGRAGDRYERNADEAADRVVAGKLATDLLPATHSGSVAQPASGAVQRQEAPAAQPAPTAVSTHVIDGPYAWQSRFDVTLTAGAPLRPAHGRPTAGECRVVVKPKFIPDAGVPPADVAAVKRRAAAAFTRLFDNQFILTDTASHTRYTLRTEVQFVDTGEHYTINLHAGNNRSNLSEWSVGRPDETFAHELGHALGLKDEYIDAAVPDRATATAPGVHTDHSIMGNYHAEGAADARMQQRHAETIGSEVGGATGHGFTVSRRP
jgi:hypothetical protein